MHPKEVLINPEIYLKWVHKQTRPQIMISSSSRVIRSEELVLDEAVHHCCQNQ